MSNIAISELNTTATSLNDEDLILVSKTEDSGNSFTSAKMKGSVLKSQVGGCQFTEDKVKNALTSYGASKTSDLSNMVTKNDMFSDFINEIGDNLDRKFEELQTTLISTINAAVEKTGDYTGTYGFVDFLTKLGYEYDPAIWNHVDKQTETFNITIPAGMTIKLVSKQADGSDLTDTSDQFLYYSIGIINTTTRETGFTSMITWRINSPTQTNLAKGIVKEMGSTLSLKLTINGQLLGRDSLYVDNYKNKLNSKIIFTITQ